MTLIVPVGLVVIVWLCFEYLVARTGTFSVGQLQHMTQAVLFVMVAIGLYFAIRYRQLRRRDKREIERVVAEETAVHEARDLLISTAVSALDGDLKRLEILAASVTLPDARQPIQDAMGRLKDMFAIALQLRGSQSTRPNERMALSTLLEQAEGTVAKRANGRGVTIKLLQDTSLAVQDPELLEYVLASVLDNAIAYSADKGTVEVDTETVADTIHVGVIDHGSGIPPDKLATLMKPFTKAGDIMEFTHECMGFSLYLDKLIMLYLGGSITLQSDLGKGTIVTLTMPNTLRGAEVISPQATLVPASSNI